MFLGEYEHSLDSKGRIIIPARHRKELGAHPVITKGVEGRLSIYPQEEFLEVAARVAAIGKRGARERRAAEGFVGGAMELEPDKQGRVAIPANLRRYARLDKEIVIVGQMSRVDIWRADDHWSRVDNSDTALREGGDNLVEIG